MKQQIITLLALLPLLAGAQKKAANSNDALKKAAGANIQAAYEQYRTIASSIWGFAEVGYKEHKSTALLQQTLSNAGFAVEQGVAGIPTAFVATFGSGKPVIGILAEFDALPGLAQQAVPHKQGIEGQDAGHGC